MKWYKHDPDAFLNGVACLTLEERGGYITLIDFYYSRKGHVPDDDWLLSRIMGCNPRTWRKVKLALFQKQKIAIDSSGCLVPNRGEYTLNEARMFSEAQSKRARTRWKSEQNQSLDDAKAAMPAQPQPQPQPESESKKERAVLTAAREGLGKQVKIERPERQQLTDEWVRVKVEICAAYEHANIPRKPDTGMVDVWAECGFKPDVVLAVVRARIAKLKEFKPLQYFQGAIEDRHGIIRRVADELKPKPIQWDTPLQHYKATGHWMLGRVSPPPGSPGCSVPAAKLAEHGFVSRETSSAGNGMLTERGA